MLVPGSRGRDNLHARGTTRETRASARQRTDANTKCVSTNAVVEKEYDRLLPCKVAA
jgi:hypothetical protein